jgi:hypothetical protein
MIDVFIDGQTWLMMDGKRLFRVPTNGTVDPEAVQHSTEVELMTPELREALKTKTPYKEAYTKIMKIMHDYQASGGIMQESKAAEQLESGEERGERWVSLRHASPGSYHYYNF